MMDIYVHRKEGILTLVKRWLQYLQIPHSIWIQIPYALAKNEAQENARTVAVRLLKENGDSILRLAYIYLHNLSDAEDVLQETLIKYMKTSPVLKNKTHEKAWLLKVAANLSKNKLRYNKIRETDELEETLQIEEKPDLTFVWEAVKMLPEKYREVIHLFYYEGYQCQEIAGFLNRKEATIRSDLRRGRQQLRDILKEEFEFE